jgi:hypothetical protein
MSASTPVDAPSPMRLGAQTALLIAAMALVAPAPARECLEVVGRWGGTRSVGPMATDGDRVVLAAGANLVIGTIAGDGTIVDLDSLALDGEPTSLGIAADVAVVARSGAPVVLVDLSDPSRARVAARLPGITGASGVLISGSTVVVADYPEGLVVVDASDPFAPTLSRLPLPGARELAFAGDLVLVVSTQEHDDGSISETLHVVDADGSALVELGSCSLPSSYALLAATAGRAYAAWCTADHPHSC